MVPPRQHAAITSRWPNVRVGSDLGFLDFRSLLILLSLWSSARYCAGLADSFGEPNSNPPRYYEYGSSRINLSRKK
jgi:hypothetical protein